MLIGTSEDEAGESQVFIYHGGHSLCFIGHLCYVNSPGKGPLFGMYVRGLIDVARVGGGSGSG